MQRQSLQENESNELCAITLRPEEIDVDNWNADVHPRISDVLKGSVRYRNINLFKFLQEKTKQHREYDREYDSMLLLAFGMTEARYNHPDLEKNARDILGIILSDERITKRGKNELLFRCIVNCSYSRAGYYDHIAKHIMEIGADPREISDILVDYLLCELSDDRFSAILDRIGRLNLFCVMEKLFEMCERMSYTKTTCRLFDFACKYFGLDDILTFVFGTPSASSTSSIPDAMLASAQEECQFLFRSAVRKTNYGVVKFLGDKSTEGGDAQGRKDGKERPLISDRLFGECLIEFFGYAAAKTLEEISYDRYLDSETDEIVKYIMRRLNSNPEASRLVVDGCIANAYISKLPAFVYVYTSPHITSKGLLFLVEGIVKAICLKRGTMHTHMSWLSTCMTRFALDRDELSALGKMLQKARLTQFKGYCKRYKVLMHASEPIKMNFEAFIGSSF